jgi:hypothetical protein
MSPSPINRPTYGPMACGSPCGSHPATGSQAPKTDRVSSDSSLASLIVILCALEALLIWAAFEGVSSAFLLFAQIAFLVVASAAYHFCRWVFEDEECKQSAHSRSWFDDDDSSSAFSRRIVGSRASSSVAGALGAGAIGPGSSRKSGSTSSDSAGSAASFSGGADGGGAGSSCSGGCSCGGGAGCGGC